MKVGNVNLTKNALSRLERLITLGEKIFPLLPKIAESDKEIVAIKLHEDKEPWFMLFGETASRMQVLRYLRGWRELSKMVEYSKPGNPPVPGWLLELNMLELHFTRGEMAFPGELELLKTLGRPTGAKQPVRPLVRSIRPGMTPWQPDIDDCEKMEQLLYQTLGILLRLEDDGEMLTRNLPYGIFMRQQDEDGEWRDGTLEKPKLPQPSFSVFVPEEIRKEFERLPMTDAKLEMDFRFLPLHCYGIGKREPLKYVLMAVNGEKKSIASCSPISGDRGIEELWNSLPAILLKLLKDIGGCPAEIHVCTERFHSFMRPFCLERPFKLVFHQHLENLQQATAMLTQSFCTNGDNGRRNEPEKKNRKDAKDDRSGN